MKNKKKMGFNNQKQGTDAEIFIMNKLKKKKWDIIPTKYSQSPIDILAHHKKKKLWWGIQVKSTRGTLSFDMDDLESICENLYMEPVIAYVKAKKPREAYFCIKRKGRLYHIFEDGEEYHELGAGTDCIAFKSKISLV